MKLKIKIQLDDLSDGKVIALLQEHRREMLKHSPPESVHALDVDAMHASNLTFWSASTNDGLIACAALKQLDSTHAELKSMKVADAFVGQGVGRSLFNYLLGQAKNRGYNRLSLETGTMKVFEPARTLYESVGFRPCPVFADYVYDPLSVCMTLEL